MKLFGCLNRINSVSQDTIAVFSQENSGATALLKSLSDSDLVAQLDSAAANERGAVSVTLRCIAEVERRGAHLELGYRTMFDYCVLRLRMSEGASSRRIYAARAAARLPILYEKIAGGELSLTCVARLSPYLTMENCEDLIKRASGARMREVETIVAGLAFKEAKRIPETTAPTVDTQLSLEVATPAQAPKSASGNEGNAGPDAKPGAGEESQGEIGSHYVVEVPERREIAVEKNSEIPEAVTAAVRKRDSITLESPGIVRYVFRSGFALREKLELAARLLGRRPDGRLETVLEILADRFLEREDPRRRTARRTASEGRKRRILRWIRDAVWRRDGGRCAYTAEDGTRCAATTQLEYDHIIPWARGGRSDDPENIRLLCRPHNLFLARKTFGDRVPCGPRFS